MRADEGRRDDIERRCRRRRARRQRRRNSFRRLAARPTGRHSSHHLKQSLRPDGVDPSKHRAPSCGRGRAHRPEWRDQRPHLGQRHRPRPEQGKAHPNRGARIQTFGQHLARHHRHRGIAGRAKVPAYPNQQQRGQRAWHRRPQQLALATTMPVQPESTAHRPAGSAAPNAMRRARLVNTRRALNPILDGELTSNDLRCASCFHSCSGARPVGVCRRPGSPSRSCALSGPIASPDLAHQPSRDEGPAQINRLVDGRIAVCKTPTRQPVCSLSASQPSTISLSNTAAGRVQRAAAGTPRSVAW